MNPVVVAGAGISGLAVAFELRRLSVPAVVLERDARPGGKIGSDRVGGYLCETGPASFRDRSGDLAALARTLEIADRWLDAGDAAERRLVAVGGRLLDMPTTALGFLGSPLLPLWAKLRAGLDLVLPRGPSANGREESVVAFGQRRLGALAGERLVEPLVSGLYAGDPAQVSLPAAFPLVAAMEHDRRSFLLAMRRDFAKAARPGAPRLASFRGGLDELTGALARHLGSDLRLAAQVAGIEREGDGFRVLVDERGARHTVAASAVVVALPAHVATVVLGRLDEPMADTLARIPYVPVVLVHLGYPAAALARSVDAYGFFVPPSEPLSCLGGIFPSQFFPERAPAGHHLFSVRMGGARHPEALTMSDRELVARADAELRGLLGLTAAPSFVHVVRHARALPQYTLGHLQRVAELLAGEARHPGLFLHGNAYHNAGVPELVSRSRQLAQRVAAFVDRAA